MTGMTSDIANLFAEVECYDMRVATVVMTDESFKQLTKENPADLDFITGKGTRARRKLGYKAWLWGAEIATRNDIGKTYVVGDNPHGNDCIIGVFPEIEPIPELIEVFKEHEVTENG